MTRQIDVSKPVSQEDADWLRQANDPRADSVQVEKPKAKSAKD